MAIMEFHELDAVPVVVLLRQVGKPLNESGKWVFTVLGRDVAVDLKKLKNSVICYVLGRDVAVDLRKLNSVICYVRSLWKSLQTDRERTWDRWTSYPPSFHEVANRVATVATQWTKRSRTRRKRTLCGPPTPTRQTRTSARWMSPCSSSMAGNGADPDVKQRRLHLFIVWTSIAGNQLKRIGTAEWSCCRSHAIELGTNKTSLVVDSKYYLIANVFDVIVIVKMYI
ncbi:uncharacterized protein LOC144201652 [Stigmatopora nigra]